MSAYSECVETLPPGFAVLPHASHEGDVSHAFFWNLSMVTIRNELPSDVGPREALLDKAFGRNRLRKTSERLREGRLPAEGLAFTSTDAKGRVIGTLRLWNVIAGSAGPSLLLVLWLWIAAGRAKASVLH